MKKIGPYVTFIYLLISVSGQECARGDTVTVGSLDYSRNINHLPAPVDRTYILAEYTIPCNGTVVAWEYCYQISSAERVIFYPGIWRITRTSDVDFYTLLQSNEVTFDSRGTAFNLFICNIFNVPDTEQFIAPAGSVVGVYTLSAQLLRTNIDDSITTYIFEREQGNVNSTGTDVNYNIAIRAQLLTSTSDTTTVTTTTSIVSTSDTTTVTTTTSIVSTTSTNMGTFTTATVSNSSGSTAIQTTPPSATTTPSDVPMLDNSGSSSDSITILIVGVVGGVVGGIILLLIITLVLCIMCMRRCQKKEGFPVNIVTLENTVTVERTVIVDHIYNSIDTRVPATTVQSHDVPKTSEDGHNFVQLNEQSCREGNNNNPPTYEESTGEDRVTAFSTTLGIRADQSLSDDTTKEYDYAYAHARAHDDHHNTGVNTKISADLDQEQGFHMNNIHVHSPKSAQPNNVYGVVNQPKCDGLCYENDGNAEGQIHTPIDQSNNTPTTYLPPSSAGQNGGGVYGVVNQHKSDDPNL